MTPERWLQIEQVFHRAAECDPSERTRLLNEAGSADPDLRREVESLLACQGVAGEQLNAAVRQAARSADFPLLGRTVSHYWGDVDFQNLTIKIQRSFVQGEIYSTKTEASESALPLDPTLADALLDHKARTVYSSDSDYVFAGGSGKPRWAHTMLADYLKPAAARAKIGSIGWHTFRHTNSTLLHALGTTSVVQKELLRHADIQTTLNVYTQAMSADKRTAASRLVDVLWRM